MKAVRVLIVDDFPQVCDELGTLLAVSGGIEVVGKATDGKEAVCMAEALRPDVILMDLEMPVMDGYEATKEVKKHSPACRVIALTVHGGKLERQKAAAAEFDDFIVKGAPLDALTLSIRGADSIEETFEGGSK